MIESADRKYLTSTMAAVLALLAFTATGVPPCGFDTGCEERCLTPGLIAVTVRSRDYTFRIAVYEALDRDIVSAHVHREGSWEISAPQDIADLADVRLPHGGVFLDIGGNVGYYALLFAKYGYTVYSVEPMWQNRAAIEASLCLNPELRARVTVLPVALGVPRSRGGTRETCIVRSFAPSNVGNGVLACGVGMRCPPARSDPGYACEQVVLTTLDALLQMLDLPAVDVVKADVEGAECDVFSGGPSLFSRYRPKLLQVETLQQHVVECVHGLARQHGYRIGAHKSRFEQNTVLATRETPALPPGDVLLDGRRP